MKSEKFTSKAALRKHEKGESPKKIASEKKSGEKDIVKKKRK